MSPGLLLSLDVSKPEPLYPQLLEELGQFPLQHFWGPLANIKSTEWICQSAVRAAETAGAPVTITGWQEPAALATSGTRIVAKRPEPQAPSPMPTRQRCTKLEPCLSKSLPKPSRSI